MEPFAVGHEYDSKTKVITWSTSNLLGTGTKMSKSIPLFIKCE